MKYCRDCKWVNTQRYNKVQYAQCDHPDNLRPSPISPDLPATYKWEFCSALRVGVECGPEGKWFEPKETFDV